jgi:hypothetical protein
MRYRRHSIATCAVILCLIAITACGANATAQFKTGYAAARGPLNRTFVDVGKTLTHAKHGSATEVAHSLGTLADRFGTELAPLEALKPPPNVATAFRTLTTSLNRVERDLRGTSVALKVRNLVAADLGLKSLRSDSGAATDAAVAIAQKLSHK